MSIIDIKFNDKYIPWLEKGIKTCTTRRFSKGKEGDAFYVNGSHYFIYQICKTKFYLALNDFEKEGFSSVQEFYDAIKKIYPDITLDDEVFMHFFIRREI